MNLRAQFQFLALVVGAVLFVGLSARTAQAQIRTLDDGPIHEAFVPPVTDVTALDAIEHEPPPDVTERIPPKPNEDAVWIKGYWVWDEDREDWVWAGGAWRRPPPGRHWIDGFWSEYDAGWVWVNGFWSPVAANDLAYIEEAPPEAFDEDPEDVPGRGYFWIAGHWHYSPDRGYVRRSGKWERLDPNWILAPGHYVWRPDGYVYVTAYLDFPVEKRGAVYRSIYVEPAARVNVVYEPVVIVEPTAVVTWCYYSYPNYVYVLNHHYHHHHDWWHHHHDVPTWWGWDSWWGLRWHDHWGVWWWYTHPGYHHPHFINVSIASRIRPASDKTIIKVKNVVKKPVIVTNNGVINAGETLQIAAKGKLKDKDGDSGKKGKSAPLVLAKGSKEKLAETATKAGKDDASGKKGDKVASLVPTGTKSAKDERDDPKKHPPKPKSSKRGGEVVTSPSGVKSKGAEKATGTPQPPVSDTAKNKGKDKGDDKGKMKAKTSPPQPPIRSKTGKSDDKSDDKSDKRSDKSDKRSDKGEDKPAKSSDKSSAKPKAPPINPPGSPSKDKDKDKDRDKDADKSKDRSSDKSDGGKSKNSKGEDKPSKTSSGEKSSKSSPPPPPTSDSGSRDKPRDSKPRGSDDKPPKTGSSDKSSRPATPPSSGSGSGDKSKDRDKDKDKEGGKKKDKDR